MNKTHIKQCNNCGKIGHMHYNCNLPIVSYGIILINQNQEYLMIRRKDTFGYIDLLRGKYKSNNDDSHLLEMINEMTITEKENIINKEIDELWHDLWSGQQKYEEQGARRKFNLLKQNGMLSKLIESSTTSWNEPEWEFPKGRKNMHEKDIECAIREFKEETGMNDINIQIIENLQPYEESFVGSNKRTYKHKYFLAYTPDINCDLSNYQTTEISKVEWKSLDACLESIRPYNLEKKELIKTINNMLMTYRLYS